MDLLFIDGSFVVSAPRRDLGCRDITPWRNRYLRVRRIVYRTTVACAFMTQGNPMAPSIQ
jgi:hypothetical protein